MVELVLTFFYHHDYYRSSEWTSLFHMEVSAAGDLYQVVGLIELAQSRLELALLEESLENGTFPARVAAIYALPPETNKRFREVAAKVAASNYGKLQEARVFTKMTWDIEDFGTDVAAALQTQIKEIEKEARVEKKLVLR